MVGRNDDDDGGGGDDGGGDDDDDDDDNDDDDDDDDDNDDDNDDDDDDNDDGDDDDDNDDDDNDDDEHDNNDDENAREENEKEEGEDKDVVEETCTVPAPKPAFADADADDDDKPWSRGTRGGLNGGWRWGPTGKFLNSTGETNIDILGRSYVPFPKHIHSVISPTFFRLCPYWLQLASPWIYVEFSGDNDESLSMYPCGWIGIIIHQSETKCFWGGSPNLTI